MYRPPQPFITSRKTTDMKVESFNKGRSLKSFLQVKVSPYSSMSLYSHFTAIHPYLPGFGCLVEKSFLQNTELGSLPKVDAIFKPSVRGCHRNFHLQPMLFYI
ncbi:hypothetical protein EGR_10200 [Echinococcus granulosus]|uniref:Uncharacterized protein n=1 Tax=Echinococcus granulosus TaxID=6210 RepID=W6U8X5_ECHGR|nr:hypothetical protein EGR_10200 [Echinococcus granulosus]EUB54942.1 hypothetical protein EGR_10200 [Echinococcus granulosus]